MLIKQTPASLALNERFTSYNKYQCRQSVNLAACETVAALNKTIN
jgi:hypothetical protein